MSDTTRTINMKHIVQNFRVSDLQSKFYFYVCLALILAGMIVFLDSYNITRTYNPYFGYPVTLGKDPYNGIVGNASYATLPQGLVGQRLEVDLHFDQQSDNNISFYVLLLPGGDRVTRPNYTDPVLNIIIPALTEKNMANYSVFVTKITYYRNLTHMSFFITFPEDNAYTVVYLLSNQSRQAGQFLTLNAYYTILGNDDLGLVLAGMLLVLGVIFFFLSLFKFNNLSLTKILFRRPATPDPVYSHTMATMTSLNAIVSEIHSEVSTFKMKSAQNASFQIKQLLKYEIRLLFGSPFIIIFLPLLVLMFEDRYAEAFYLWNLSGSYAFQELGTTLSADGITRFYGSTILILFFCILFFFRELDENIYQVHLTLPRKRSWYLLVKFVTFIIPILLGWVVFVSAAYIIIPLRNPTVGFLPVFDLFLIYFCYVVLTLILGSIAFFIVSILMNSRTGLLAWIIIIFSWYYYTMDMYSKIHPHEVVPDPFHITTQLESNFTLASLERVFEFFIKRPMFPDLSSGYFIYTHDSVLNSLLVLSFYSIIIIVCLVLSLMLFRRRDL